MKNKIESEILNLGLSKINSEHYTNYILCESYSDSNMYAKLIFDNLPLSISFEEKLALERHITFFREYRKTPSLILLPPCIM